MWPFRFHRHSFIEVDRASLIAQVWIPLRQEYSQETTVKTVITEKCSERTCCKWRQTSLDGEITGGAAPLPGVD